MSPCEPPATIFERIASVLAVHDDAVGLGELAALRLGGVDSGLRDLLNGGKLAVGRADDRRESDLGVRLVDGCDLILGERIGRAEQRRDDQRNGGQRAGDLENEFTFDLHYFAASFLAFLSTPKRVGLVYLSMIQVQQFMIRME